MGLISARRPHGRVPAAKSPSNVSQVYVLSYMHLCVCCAYAGCTTEVCIVKADAWFVRCCAGVSQTESAVIAFIHQL